MNYGSHVIEVRQTTVFREWLIDLRDGAARSRIIVRIRRLELGNPGDLKSVGDGVLELRIPHGPGYRVYLTYQGRAIVILLCGGDKSTQRRDMVVAKRMAKEI